MARQAYKRELEPIDVDGYKFYPSYDPKADWVYVQSPHFVDVKDARAGPSGPEVIARFLAGELIANGRKI